MCPKHFNFICSLHTVSTISALNHGVDIQSSATLVLGDVCHNPLLTATLGQNPMSQNTSAKQTYYMLMNLLLQNSSPFWAPAAFLDD